MYECGVGGLKRDVDFGRLHGDGTSRMLPHATPRLTLQHHRIEIFETSQSVEMFSGRWRLESSPRKED
jgi:hypothetical protein